MENGLNELNGLPKYQIDLKSDYHMFHVRCNSKEEMNEFMGGPAEKILALMRALDKKVTPPQPPANAPHKPVMTSSVACQFCNGPTWDNQRTKRTPKHPDFKCRDTNCGAAAWVQKSGQLSWKAGQAKPVENPAPSLENDLNKEELPF